MMGSTLLRKKVVLRIWVSEENGLRHDGWPEVGRGHPSAALHDWLLGILELIYATDFNRYILSRLD